MTSSRIGHLYFHAPCFDGMVSAVLVSDYLEGADGWTRVELHPVNYDARATWLDTALHQPSAVVDFLYHPAAMFWADHHATTFLTSEVERAYRRAASKGNIYDAAAGSCSALLWNELLVRFGHRSAKYEALVQWADKIDSARYESPEEAVYSRSPALRINASLAIGEARQFATQLVKLFRDKSLMEVASSPVVKERSEEFDRLVRRGMERFEKAVSFEGGIVTFDVDATDVMISRYAPFLGPHGRAARYSAGIVRFKGGAKITVMRNPWNEFESLPLGELCAHFGGGGHQRIGSIVLKESDAGRASSILRNLVRTIRESETHAVS